MSSTTDDLVEFLRARLEEDEQVARAAAAQAGGMRWRGSDSGLCNEDTANHPGPFLADAYGYLDPALVAHIARHDPARELPDVESKRRIVEWARRMNPAPGMGGIIAGEARKILKWLALPYADHHEYQESWRP